MTILMALACHFVGDFAFQSEWLASQKGKSWEINLYHCLIYTAVFVLAGCLWWQALVLLGSHFIIDPLKARWNIVRSIWLDQLLHVVVILLLFNA